MKLIIAIIHDEDSSKVMEGLNKQGFGVTKLCSSGGFLKAGNTTLLVGIEDDKVNIGIETILMNTEPREHKIKTPKTANSMSHLLVPSAAEVVVSGATIFVTDVERYEKF
jgi:Uncharacterized protein conserved in bacteria